MNLAVFHQEPHRLVHAAGESSKLHLLGRAGGIFNDPHFAGVGAHRKLRWRQPVHAGNKEIHFLQCTQRQGFYFVIGIEHKTAARLRVGGQDDRFGIREFHLGMPPIARHALSGGFVRRGETYYVKLGLADPIG